MRERLHLFLTQKGLGPTEADILTPVLLVAAVAIISALGYVIARRIVLRSVAAIVLRTKTEWDDAIVRCKVLDRLAHLLPALMIYLLVPMVVPGREAWIEIIRDAASIYTIVIVGLAISALLNASLQIYDSFDISREIPIKSFVQVLKIAAWFVGGILIISILVDKAPFLLLSGLGALTAVILLIFRDSILGFVAGVQLSANKMLSHGDWIEMPKYGADGEVEEVALTTVKVRNWDKTITTIPTYALISESFRNWRGMKDSGGRRIKRSIFIDVQTIRLCDEAMLERFSKIQYISDYIARKKDEVARYNEEHGVDDTSAVNGRRLTNIGTFRAYVRSYLWNHPMIHRDMTFLVRQLQPTENGLPIEIYVFSRDTVWANYEAIQADIFDHIMAVAQEFDLRIYQSPSGGDVRDVLERRQ